MITHRITITGPAHTRGTGYNTDEAGAESQGLHPAIQCLTPPNKRKKYGSNCKGFV